MPAAPWLLNLISQKLHTGLYLMLLSWGCSNKGKGCLENALVITLGKGQRILWTKDSGLSVMSLPVWFLRSKPWVNGAWVKNNLTSDELHHRGIISNLIVAAWTTGLSESINASHYIYFSVSASLRVIDGLEKVQGVKRGDTLNRS